MSLAFQATSWSPTQVQDTVNRIVARAAYQRDFAESLMDRLFRAIWEFVTEIVRGIAELGGMRMVVYGVLIELLLLLEVRLVLDLRAEMERGVVTGRRGGSVRTSDPWAEAERLARELAFTEAAHALFRALLGALGARGEVSMHASKTAGDYARELRRQRAGSATGFQRFHVRYDRAIYGERIVTADEYRALLAEARPILAPDRTS